MFIEMEKEDSFEKRTNLIFVTFILTGIGFPVNVVVAVIIITLSIRHDASVTAR